MSSIDIRTLISSKNPAAVPPDIILRQLERLLCLSDLNTLLSQVEPTSTHENIAGAPAEFVRATLKYLHIELRIHGAEELEGVERPLLVSNHPLGILDGLALISVLFGYFKEIRLMVNALLMNISQLKDIFVPVSKLDSNREYMKTYREMFMSDAAIIHFPAGLCSRRRGGRLSDPPWNWSYIHFSRKSKRPIVPCFFAGQNSAFFYALANLRRWFHIGFNIEMFFLIAEMFKQQGNVLECWIGKPIDPSMLMEKNTRNINTLIRRRVYSLRGDSL